MKTRKMIAWVLTGVVFCSAVLTSPGISSVSQAKTVKAKLYVKKVKIGKRIKIKTETEDVTYESSNSVIASVDAKGVVTGKKAGKVKISVRRKGYKTKKYTITVEKRKRKPTSLPVTLSEVSIANTAVAYDTRTPTGELTGGTQHMSYITNHAKKGTIKRIVYYYKVPKKVPVSSTPTKQPSENPSESPSPVSPGAVTAEEATAAPAGTEAPDSSENTVAYKNETWEITVTAKNIGPGKRVKAERAGKNAEDTTLPDDTLTKVELYTGKALYVYDADKSSYTLKWGTKDTKPPVITGLVKGKSGTGYNDIYRVYYSDRKNRYKFDQFVTAVDDRDGKVKVKADTSKINWGKSGVYKLWFTAVDRAGNKAESWAKVRVYTPGSAESAADQVLRSITRESWSDEKKARAIYRFIRGKCSYVNHTIPTDWRVAGLKGLRYRSGDCYSYYAMSRLLLTRAGLTNVLVKRYPVPKGQPHYWSLVYVRGGWYHFDTTPRHRNANFCLWTDAQMWSYSSGYVFQFRRNYFPARATKKL